ncbi:MAG: DUF554 domain-containing protein [Clostridia bacterium]|nr:DUF554 domain-containing protein [Clostridia bacterium]MBO7295689.1 DUF554 domain-containing protein [Clostridia bacterium]
MENFPLWGTLVNTGTVVAGSLFGLLIHLISKKGKLKSQRFSEVSASIMRGLGLAVVMVGIGGALKGVIYDAVGDAVIVSGILAEGLYSDNAIITILSIVIGVLIGGLIDIDHWVNLLGKKVETLFNRKPEQNAVHVPVAQGFVSASLLFCVGSMTIVGSIQSGLSGNHDLLYTKSLLDFVSSIVLSSTMGIGVLLSSAFVLVFQGGIALVANLAGQGLSAAVIDAMSCVGSVLIVGLGLNVMGITNLKIMNYLPAVFLPIALVPLWDFITGLIALI